MGNEVAARSPLKSPPLRNPGQSLDEEIQQLFVDRFLPYFLFPPLFIAYAIGEWWRWYRPSTPYPWTMTVLALVSVVYSVYQIRKLRPKIHALKLGRDGEKIVGQSLEEFANRWGHRSPRHHVEWFQCGSRGDLLPRNICHRDENALQTHGKRCQSGV